MLRTIKHSSFGTVEDDVSKCCPCGQSYRWRIRSPNHMGLHYMVPTLVDATLTDTRSGRAQQSVKTGRAGLQPPQVAQLHNNIRGVCKRVDLQSLKPLARANLARSEM